MKIIEQLKGDAIIELTADDLRFTCPGMPCEAHYHVWENPTIFNSISFKSEIIIGHQSPFFWENVITALLSDWRKYTAKRPFELQPEAMFITRGKWWSNKPIFFRGDNWYIDLPYLDIEHSLPDLWPEQPDEKAIISREEVMNDKND